MPESIYILDTFSLIFQVFHAIGSEMTSPQGQPTNAVYGFTRDLNTLLKDHKPDYWLAAMDSPGEAVRSGWYPEYKTNRSEMPPDLRPQIPMIQQVLEAFGIPVIQHDGWEADDVMATVTKLAVAQGLDVILISSDKDCRQLLGPHVRMLNLRKNTYFGVNELKSDWGITPEQAIDFQSLVGDSVDNVPGVPLVGPKKASALLLEFGDLEGVLANADKAPGAKLKENLKVFADQARLCKRLVRLYDDLPLAVDWNQARAGQLQHARLGELFTEFGFKRLADEIKALRPAADVHQPLPAQQTRDWKIVDTPEKFAAFLEQFLLQKRFCLDTETTSVDAVRADIVGWAICWEVGSGYYIPVRGPAGQAMLDPAMVVAAFKPHLEDPTVEISNQNIKYDMLVLRRAGINIATIGSDPMIFNYLLDAGARSHGQDELSKRYLGHEMIPITALIGTGKNQKSMTEIDIHVVAEYAVEDAEIALQLCGKLEPILRHAELWDLYWDLERPLIPVLAEMEHRGIKVDAELLRTHSKSAGERLELIQAQIYGLAGREFNIDSPIQLREILFTELKLPVFKKTKTGPSTDQEVLEQLAVLHPLPNKLMEHRKLSKLKSTYLDALPEMVNPETGRIHASFNQVVAATGRLSSSDPNLQNIPIRTEEGRRVRSAFIPGEPGWKLVSADYSQIELRILAHYSHDKALQMAFAAGVDIHTAVAAEIYGFHMNLVSGEMRRVAKAVNFGVIYGQSPYGLSAAIGISQDEAGRFIDDYFTKYAGVEAFIEKLLEECRQTGYATTIKGRRRAITGIRELTGRRQLTLPERTAVNTVIQGSAADLIKLAMIRIHNRLKAENHPGRMLLQIHDELVFEVPEAEVASLQQLVREEMEQAIKLDVPLKVDVSVGDNWAVAK
ncbi:MAG: polymerase [Planctomycetaceae bacterium]|nr:polymerase [Planctomycetaceae bacterium]